MKKNYFSKINLLKLFFLMNILKSNLFHDKSSSEISRIILTASNFGYDLTNPNDEFYIDICIAFSDNKKDVTLDYRRKYFFFPKYNDSKNKFIYPRRNDTKSCFFMYFEIKNFFSNLAFYIIFPLFLFQFIMVLIGLIITLDKVFYNTPAKKMELQKSFKCCLFKYKKNINKNNNNTFSEFIPDTLNTQQIILKDDNFNEREQNMKIKDKNLMNNQEKENDIKIPSKNCSNSQESLNKTIKYSISNTTEIVKKKSSILQSNGTAQFNNSIILDEEKEKNKNDKENIENNNIKEKMNISVGEDDFDILSFGMSNTFQQNTNKDEKKIPNSKDSNIIHKKEENLKKTQIIYNTLNKENKINNVIKKSNYIPSFKDPNKKVAINIIYIREEYFYFGYLLARIQDKRTLLEIYCDLLEQCHFIFKIFFTPFNIFEDYKIQLAYYALKVELYFYFNCILINNNVINNIYDNKNNFSCEFYRSIISCIFTYIISIFIYKISNIKKILITRRYKLENLGFFVQRTISEISKLTYKMGMDILFTKLILFIIIILFIFLYSFYTCYSFCSVYIYTQIYILKGVLFSIIISLISPFIFCWIPSYARIIAISKKSERLYKIAKNIEFLFVA